MMLLLSIVFVLCTPSCSVLTTELNEEWNKFKKDYSKQYASTDLEFNRREIWEDNYEYINEHNKQADTGLHTFWLAMNEYGDLTNKEFTKTRDGYIIPKNNLNIMPEDNSNIMQENFVASLPTEVDWRKKGYVTPVRNEGDCLSYWAFSPLGAVEGQHFKATGQLNELSAQNLIDCSQQEGNLGCKGGFMFFAYNYIIRNKGVDTTAAYPYEAKQGTCNFTRQNVGATISSFVSVPAYSEMALQKAVALIGPVSVGIDNNHTSYQFYKKGVYYEPKCSQDFLWHANLVTGYGVYNNTDYWMVKDSYGTNWGMNGYIMMSRNRNNNCGIASLATYPVV